MESRYFELVDGTSRKFWSVGGRGSSLVVRFGRIGTEGQTSEKKLGSPAAAKKERDRLVAEKMRKGYAEKAAVSARQAPKLVGELYQITNFVMTLVIDAKAAVLFMDSAKSSELRAIAKKWPPERTGTIEVGAIKALSVELGSLTGSAGHVYIFRIEDRIVLLEGPSREQSNSEAALAFVASPPSSRSKRIGDFSFGDVVALAPGPDIFGEAERVRPKMSQARTKGAATLLDDDAVPTVFLSVSPATTYRASVERTGKGASKMARLILSPNASKA